MNSIEFIKHFDSGDSAKFRVTLQPDGESGAEVAPVFRINFYACDRNGQYYRKQAPEEIANLSQTLETLLADEGLEPQLMLNSRGRPGQADWSWAYSPVGEKQVTMKSITDALKDIGFAESLANKALTQKSPSHRDVILKVLADEGIVGKLGQRIADGIEIAIAEQAAALHTHRKG